jgi:glycosyltransferase involved in cell wall biosynthesis
LDIAAHTSTQPEPFGLTIVEAMACGTPVIVSRAGGAAEIFTDGHDALGFQPGDASSLTSAIERLVESAELRQRLGKNARQTAEERFSRRRLGPQLLATYDRCCRS